MRNPFVMALASLIMAIGLVQLSNAPSSEAATTGSYCAGTKKHSFNFGNEVGGVPVSGYSTKQRRKFCAYARWTGHGAIHTAASSERVVIRLYVRVGSKVIRRSSYLSSNYSSFSLTQRVRRGCGVSTRVVADDGDNPIYDTGWSAMSAGVC